jgi:hypothetical protein
MAPTVTYSEDTSLSRFERRFLYALLTVVLVYWGICALVVPVVTWDSQVYNLARLLVAEHGSFLNQDIWNSQRQIFFPWAFDAVHYPFVKLGFGESLPSYACLLGTIVILLQMGGRFVGTRVALWTSLAWLGMPTMITQAASTKNDMVVVFTAAVWLYALYRYHLSQRRIYLIFVALAIGLMVGSKTSGVILGAMLGAGTLVYLWTRRRNLGVFVGSAAIALCLWGSTETYLVNEIRFGSLLGAKWINNYSNRDGVRGAMASFVRYYLGNVSLGLDGRGNQTNIGPAMEEATRRVLTDLGLKNVGYRIGLDDSTLSYLKTGWDAAWDFGLVGCISLFFGTAILFTRRFRSIEWAMAFAGVSLIVITCFTVAWMEWNARFLVLPIALLTLATCVVIFRNYSRVVFPQRLFGAAIMLSLIATPFLSIARNPWDLIASIKHRQTITFLLQPHLRPLYEDLKRLSRHSKAVTVFLYAGEDSWTLEFLRLTRIHWVPTQRPLEHVGQVGNVQPGSAFLLVLDREVPEPVHGLPFKAYGDKNTLVSLAP